MEQIQEMLDHISVEVEAAVEKRKQLWGKIDTTEIKSQLQNFYKQYSDSEDHKIVISYLKSSYITGSHKFKLASYEEEPFVELYPPHEYLNMKPLFDNIEADMTVFTKQLSQHFFRLMPSEQEEIRRHYMEMLYIESALFFKRVLSETDPDIKATSIFFGAELGEVKRMGAI